MSFLIFRIVHLYKKSLPMYGTKQVSARVNRTPLFARLQRGSFTVEAAWVIPLVTFFLAGILFLFRVLQVETQVYSALSYASRKTAAVCSMTDTETAERISSELYFRDALSNYEDIEDYVAGGSYGITLLTSDFSGEYVDLKAQYLLKFPFPFFSIGYISVYQESKSRKWIGNTKQQDDDSWVFVTDYGNVYHCTRTCNYLDLSVQSVKSTTLEALRNKDEHKYYACELCAAENNTPFLVYVTDYGTAYHTSLSCSGLKRTVTQVRLSEVGNRAACSKCGR